MLMTDSLRVFIQLMWQEYQPKIQLYFFFPYILYMFLFSFTLGYFSVSVLGKLFQEDYEDTNGML